MVKRHACHLTRYEFDIVDQCIDSGPFILARRKFRRLLMIHPSHPYAKHFIRSSSALEEEEVRHLLQYYQMIHPFSLGKLYWNMVMIFVDAGFFIFIPVHLSIDSDLGQSYVIVGYLNIIHFFDMLICFMTGYYDDEKNRVIMDPLALCKKYVCGMFMFDSLSALWTYLYPPFLYCYFTRPYIYNLRFLGLLKIARVSLWFEHMNQVRLYYQFSSYFFKGFQLVTLLVLIIFWCFAIVHFFFYSNWSWVMKFTDPNFSKAGLIMESFYDTIKMLLMVAYSKPDRDDLTSIYISVGFIAFGFLLHLFILIKIFQIWSEHSSADSNRERVLRHLNNYASLKLLRPSLKAQLNTYFDFRYQKQWYYKNSVLNSMSSKLLHDEAVRMSVKPRLEAIDMFQDMPEKILMALAERLKSKVFLPGDVIIRAGDVGNSMYIICAGTVAVYSDKGKEIGHLEDGTYFGEVGMIYQEERLMTVTAITCVELLKLNRMDFKDAMRDDWDLRKKIEEYIMDKVLSQKERKTLKVRELFSNRHSRESSRIN